jgi:hypothetical protein
VAGSAKGGLTDQVAVVREPALVGDAGQLALPAPVQRRSTSPRAASTSSWLMNWWS